MNREEFQQEITKRFKNTDSGFGNMTQRELILLQVASNIYHEQINNLSDVVRSIFAEMQNDERDLHNIDRNTKEFKEGFKEAIRILAIIIKQETKVDVRK